MADSELTRLQQRYDSARARCEDVEGAIRGLGFEPVAPLLPGQPAPLLSEAQVEALTELREADEEAAQARDELQRYLSRQAGDARR